jgi:hypothetical protein
MHKGVFSVNYNTLLHVSTLLGHLQGETFCCRYTRLYYTVERECAVGCVLCTVYWRRELFCDTGLYKPGSQKSSRLQKRRSAVNSTFSLNCVVQP